MPMWLLNKDFWLGIGILILIIMLIASVHAIFGAGETKEIAKQAIAQIAQNNIVRGKYAKVLKKVPNGNDDAAINNFLLKYTSDSQ